MTLLQAYVWFGLPIMALALAGGALWLTRPRQNHHRHTPAE
jgi:hypothetical protein